MKKLTDSQANILRITYPYGQAPRTLDHLADASPYTRETVRNATRTLVDAGHLAAINTPDGTVYTITHTGRTALRAHNR